MKIESKIESIEYIRNEIISSLDFCSTKDLLDIKAYVNNLVWEKRNISIVIDNDFWNA